MSESRVRQWQSTQDGIENLKVVEVEMPEIGQGEVLVKIRAVSLNYRDTEVVMGSYGHHKAVHSGNARPIVPCSDMCGVVVAIGEEATWRVGDRVVSTFNQGHLSGRMSANILSTGLGLPLDGVLQTHRVFPSTGLVKAPCHMTDEEASCLPIAAVTAWMSINQGRPIGQPGGQGETILLQGTGGVSIMGLQLAHAAGAKTIITSSSDEKLEKAKALGADHVINYRQTQDWDQEVLKYTNQQGVDIVFECGGAQTLRKSFNSLTFGGTITSIGYLSGKQDEPGDNMNINVLALSKTAILRGVINGPRDRFEEMIEFLENHTIHPVVDRVFKFDEGKDAISYLYSGSHFGKVVVMME